MIGSIADSPRSSVSESIGMDGHEPGPPGGCWGPGSGGSDGAPCGSCADGVPVADGTGVLLGISGLAATVVGRVVERGRPDDDGRGALVDDGRTVGVAVVGVQVGRGLGFGRPVGRVDVGLGVGLGVGVGGGGGVSVGPVVGGAGGAIVGAAGGVQVGVGVGVGCGESVAVGVGRGFRDGRPLRVALGVGFG